jgi:hypothetical protein
MTPGVAPRASKSGHAMGTRPTTLTEFVDEDVDVDAETECDDAPTPESNADDIEHLIDAVTRLNEKVGDIVGELEQRDTDAVDSIDMKPNTERMFH